MNDDAKISFPCDYPIKIVGMHTDDFVDRVTMIVRQHVTELVPEKVTVRMSRNDRYCSVTCNIVATGELQLQAINKALQADPAVSMVL